MKTILLGPPKYETLMAQAVEKLKQAGFTVVPNPGDTPITADHIAEYADSCVAVIAGPEPWNESTMSLLPDLRIIAKCGAGVDNIDLDAARQRGITVTNTPGMNSQAVAEFAVALMLVQLRGIVTTASGMQAGTRIHFAGQELAQKTVGILGWGNIGRRVAKLLGGFDVNLVVHDPFLQEAPPGVQLVDSPLELAQMVDVISLHMPATEQTTGLVNKEFLDACKDGVYLVNTARGAIVDEFALANALQTGKVAGAALDVLATDVGAVDTPLLGLPNVVLTPHLGAETLNAYANVGEANRQDVLSVLSGQKPARALV